MMPPKAIDKRNPMETRDAIWATIRKLKLFTAADLAIRCSRDTIRDYLKGLQAAGYIEYDFDNTNSSEMAYRLIRDCGVDAPRVRKDGSEVTQGKGREQMWRTMKIIGDFTPHDLAIHASTEQFPVTEVEAKNYTYHLYKAGYLAKIGKSKPGSKFTPGVQASYRLLPSKITGPLPPMVQRIKQVYDPNTRKVVWSQADGGGQ